MKSGGVEVHRFVVRAEDSGKRIDQVLAERVLHEDRSIIAVDKPAGIPSHATLARRQGSAMQLVEELLRRRSGGKQPVWPLHRLDTATSGVLVFAKSARAARATSRGFAERRIRKRYHALVHGVPVPAAGDIALPIVEGSLRSDVAAHGKEATTRYRVLEDIGAIALVELEPLTGRMHQLRVHLAAAGHPVVGDDKYGREPERAPRLFLHASRIELPHPDGGRMLTVEGPLPAEFEAAMAGSTARR